MTRLRHGLNPPFAIVVMLIGEIPPTDAQTQAVFDQGHEFGSLAETLFPDDIKVGQGCPPDP